MGDEVSLTWEKSHSFGLAGHENVDAGVMDLSGAIAEAVTESS